LLQEFLCKNTRLWEAIDESIGGGFDGEVIHGDELFREVPDLMYSGCVIGVMR
jgi:hypothetical protein